MADAYQNTAIRGSSGSWPAFDHLWRDRRGLHSHPLQEIVDDIATGRLKIRIGKTFLIYEIGRAVEEVV
jgi:hypothetical protein